MTNYQQYDIETLFGTLDDIIGQELVRNAFRYGLGLLLVEEGAAKQTGSNKTQLTIKAAGGESITLPRPAELSPSQEQMVKTHVNWLLQARLP